MNKQISIKDFTKCKKSIYDANVEHVKEQLAKTYENLEISVCWSPFGLIGTEVNGIMHKGKTTYDVLQSQIVEINISEEELKQLTHE